MLRLIRRWRMNRYLRTHPLAKRLPLYDGPSVITEPIVGKRVMGPIVYEGPGRFVIKDSIVDSRRDA